MGKAGFKLRPGVDFGISGAELSEFRYALTGWLISRLCLREIGQERGMWMQLAHYCVHWTRVSAALNLEVCLTLLFWALSKDLGILYYTFLKLVSDKD